MHLPSRFMGVVVSAALGCAAQPASRTDVDARSIELGTSTSELVSLLGAPTRTQDRNAADRTFRTYFYPDHLTVVVDLTTDVVCKVSVGETDGYCY